MVNTENRTRLHTKSTVRGIGMKLLPRSLRLQSICLFLFLLFCPALVQTAAIPQSDSALIDSLYSWADFDSAIIIARELSTKYPDDPRPFHLLGTLIVMSGNRDLLPEAEASLSRCLELRPNEAWMTAWSHLRLAFIYFETKRDSQAVVYCNKAIELNATKNCTIAARKLLHSHGHGTTKITFPVTRRTEHFVFHYPDSAMVRPNTSRDEQEYEKAYDRLADFWGCAPSSPVNVFMYHTEEEIESVVGQAAHLAYPEKYEIHTTLRATTGHELTHIFAYYFNNGKVPTLLWEGIPVVLNQAHSRFSCDLNAATKLKNSPEVSLAGINTNRQQLDYDYTGSFAYLLVEDYGRDNFLALYRMRGPLEDNVPKIYGVSFADLEQCWRKRIETLVELLPVMDSLLTAGRKEGHRLAIEKIDQQIAQHGSTAELVATKEMLLKAVRVDSVSAIGVMDYGIAVEQVNRVLASFGKTAELIGMKGQFLTDTGRYREAIETFEELLTTKSYAIEPPYIFQAAHYNLGKCYAELGEKGKAIPHLKEAIQIDQAYNITADADSLLSSLTK
jgi:tetratricopeptide (TPR) repeat protein